MKSVLSFVTAIVLTVPNIAVCETTHGLFMWVENAPNTAPLPHSRKAVSKIKASLVTYGASSYGSFKMQECKRRLGRSCRDDVLNVVRTECKKVGEKDTFIFVWSSHGSEQDNDQHFYLADGEGIYLSDILKTIGESSRAKANVVIITACRTPTTNQSNDLFNGP